MRVKRLIATFTSFLFVMSTFMFGKINVKAADSPAISYSISQSSISPGDTFDITVNCANMSDLYGAAIDFKYDTSLIQVTGIDKGSVFSSTSVNYATPTNDTTNGLISFYEMLTGDVAGSNVTTASSLFVIHAKALKTGTINLNTTDNTANLTYTGFNVCVKLSDSSANKISYTATGQTLNITNAKRIEENNANITYTGIWNTDSNSNYSSGSAKYTKSSDGSLSFSFTGTGIDLIGVPNSNMGIAKVTIDGTIYSVDLYSSSIQYQKSVFSKTGLTSGTHTIKIACTGTKNSASSNYYIDFDAFDITEGDILAPANRVEENNTYISYTGTWNTDTNANYSSGYAKYTKSTDGSLSFSFTGTGINLIGVPNCNMGIAKVTIDGTDYYVDLYSSSIQYQKSVFTKYDLVSGTHTITITCTGTKNSASSNSYIDFDAFDITGGNILAPTKRIEENNANIAYSGTWNSESNTKYSGSSSKYTNIAGSSLSFSFTGTGISLIGVPNSNMGIAKVTIDGNAYSVDLYSSSIQYQKSVFSKTDLTSGTHTITIAYTGTKNSASSNYYIDFDAFDIAGGDIAVPAKRIEENNANITYNGTWTSESNTKYSGSSSKYTNIAGSSLSFSFTGTGISLIGVPNSNMGIAKVTIDGTAYSVDLYSSSIQYQKSVFSKTDLTSGTHTITIAYTGTKNSASSNYYIDFDAFDITGGDIAVSAKRIEENNANITYNGTWTSESNTKYSGSSSKYTNIAGSSLSFSFTGTGISLIGVPNSNMGIAKVTIDGTAYSVDLYSSSIQYQKSVFSKIDLTSGTHTITIAYTGTKNSASSNYYIDFDAFDITGGDIAVSAKRIEENNANITYTGSWFIDTNTKYSNGSAKFTSVPNSSLSFSFTGTGISLIGVPNSNMGIAKVTIDGTAYMVDLYSSSIQYQKSVFSKTDLGSGTHTITIAYTGTKNSASSNYFIDFDAFDITGGDITTK